MTINLIHNYQFVMDFVLLRYNFLHLQSTKTFRATARRLLFRIYV